MASMQYRAAGGLLELSYRDRIVIYVKLSKNKYIVLVLKVDKESRDDSMFSAGDE